MQRIAPAARSAMTVTIGNSIESMSFTTFTPPVSSGQTSQCQRGVNPQRFTLIFNLSGRLPVVEPTRRKAHQGQERESHANPQPDRQESTHPAYKREGTSERRARPHNQRRSQHRAAPSLSNLLCLLHGP
ncbi:hypothetical protein GQ600_22504 [Phytophthora cactorum]|nr:hypothetical protein GQ600_22504 [Phytophthora cactorum]